MERNKISVKKIYVVDTWRRIKRTMVTFCSIILIVCLGIASYLGIGFAKISMEETANHNYTEQKFHNFEISYNYGLTDKDMTALLALSGIDVVEGLYRTTGFLKINEINRLVTVQSVTKNVDIANVIEGRLPEAENEIAIEKVMAEDDGTAIGTTITIICEDTEGNSSLKNTEFEVVGIVEHPAYTCNYVYSRRGVSEKGNGNCLNYFLVSETAFSESIIENGYQSVLLWSDELAESNCFGDECKQQSLDIQEQIEEMSFAQSNSRLIEIKDKYSQQVAEAQKEIEDAKVELDDSAMKIEDAKKQIEDAENALNSLKEILPDGDYTEQEQQIEDGKAELAEKEETYQQAQQDITENEIKIQDAQRKIDDLSEINWNIYDRNANISFALCEDNAEGLGKLSFSFAFVYIVVSLMVCYSSIGRMITKQKNLIGTQKALGFRPIEIYLQYISYAWVSTFWGSVYGILWAVFFVEKLSLKSYKPIYYFDDYFSICDFKLTAVVVSCAFVLTFIATIIACKKQINKPTVSLLKDEVIKEGKEFWFEKKKIWKKIALLRRTIIKNLFNEKSHMLTMIIGIAGCTALMIIGFTLKFAMSDVKKVQFEQIQQFDISLQVEPDTVEHFSDILEGYSGVEKIAFKDQMIGVRLNGENNIVADLLCTDTKAMNEFFLLEDDVTGQTVENSDEGVYISSNTANYYNVNIGDEIQVLEMNGEEVTVPVVGILKNYVCHFLVMSPSYYEKNMSESAENNIFFLKLDGITKEELKKELVEEEGFISIAGKEMGISIFDNIVSSLNSVVELMICLSAIMALIVVLNLIVMYINEKSKNLAVMRINGFTIRETKSFITFSNVILTILGLVVGVMVGIIVGIQIVCIIENDCVAYNHSPNIMACLISCGISVFYATVIGMIGNRKINKLELNNLNRYE